MGKIYITITAACVLAMTAEAQQRPGGSRPGGVRGQARPGNGLRNQARPDGGRFGRGGPGGGSSGFADLFRQMQGTDGGGTFQERMAAAARRSGVTFNEAPTMRMSMFDVVERIGGAEAEAILIENLEITARPAEIVHLDGNLERLAGDKYVKDILAAAKAVLANPPELDADMRADAGGTDALWGLLRKYEDDSFVDFAKEMLIDKDGKMHRPANDYLRQFLKDDIMKLYKEAYANPNFDDSARATIRREAQNRMGENAAANAIIISRFGELMNELANPPAEPVEGQLRSSRSNPRTGARSYLQALGQGRDLTPETIAGRKALLVKLRATTSDSEVTALMDKVDERLTALSDPEKAKNLRGFSLGGRGSGGFGRGGDQGPGTGQGPGGGQRPGGGKKK